MLRIANKGVDTCPVCYAAGKAGTNYQVAARGAGFDLDAIVDLAGAADNVRRGELLGLRARLLEAAGLSAASERVMDDSKKLEQ